MVVLLEKLTIHNLLACSKFIRVLIMGLRQIREHFKVNAKRGCLIKFTSHDGVTHILKIVSAKNGKINAISLDDSVRRVLHPTLNIEYL